MPHSVCSGRCKFTCEASDVAIVRTVENNVIPKSVDGTLWERRRGREEEVEQTVLISDDQKWSAIQTVDDPRLPGVCKWPIRWPAPRQWHTGTPICDQTSRYCRRRRKDVIRASWRSHTNAIPATPTNHCTTDYSRSALPVVTGNT